jgi:aryl-alcohol dehydrogenase-like predicted oxidoreductase
MEYRVLGRSGIRVSALGLGTVKLGRDRKVNYPRAFTIPDDQEARTLLERARDLGVNLLDTAPAYGSSEARLGELLEGQRQQWVIGTKVGEVFTDGRSHYDFTPEHVTASVFASLARLRTDWLDYVLIHSDGRDREILTRHGTLEALCALRARGVIRAVGISHKSADGAACAIDVGCDVIMATLNPLHTVEAPVIARAASAGCGVLIKKALASGYAAPEDIRFAASHPGVSSVVVGTVNPEHLADNARLLRDLQQHAR